MNTMNLTEKLLDKLVGLAPFQQNALSPCHQHLSQKQSIHVYGHLELLFLVFWQHAPTPDLWLSKNTYNTFQSPIYFTKTKLLRKSAKC